MQVRRTRFVHLPRRLPPAAKTHASGENAQDSRSFEAKPQGRAQAAAARVNTASVLWRAVPEWNSLPADPLTVTASGTRAYQSAASLGTPAPRGRLTDRRI